MTPDTGHPAANEQIDGLTARFRKHFGTRPAAAAYAPGRIEVLGNHTDYNEGLVLSAAIDLGTVFLLAPSAGAECRLVAADLTEAVSFPVGSPAPCHEHNWANYVIGVLAGLRPHADFSNGFDAMFSSTVPLAAGLSSSAALELAAALCLCQAYGIALPKLELARIAQRAEHEYAGVRCGLMDQISSLYGIEDNLVITDFRTLAVGHVPVSAEVAFLMCNTGVKHTLVDSEYNERRRSCESAAASFAGLLDRKVTALRDVSYDDWKRQSGALDPVTARRASHIIGENTRVAFGRELLGAGRIREFGELMFQSHESSRTQFENSCAELDFIVATARDTDGVLGARLSGGGFGGSAVVLVENAAAPAPAAAVGAAYESRFSRACEVRKVRAAAGAWTASGQGGVSRRRSP